MASEKRYKVLIIAEAANPEWTSVPLIGWSLSEALSKVCDAHLATQIRNQEAIERTGWVNGKEFTAINAEKILKPAYKLSTLLRGGKIAVRPLLQPLIVFYPYFEYLC